MVSAAFSPDGQRVVTASWDKTARLWDIASGHELAVMRGHECEIQSAEFSPDGQCVVTAAGSPFNPADNTARLWRVFATTQELIDYAKSIVPRQLTPEQRRQFFLEESVPEVPEDKAAIAPPALPAPFEQLMENFKRDMERDHKESTNF